MRHRFTTKILAVVLATVSIVSALTETLSADGPGIRYKAARAFNERDWGSAQAYYTIFAHEEPSDSVFSARAIVASFAMGDTLTAIDEMQKSMAEGIGLDGLLTQIRTEAFSVGESSIYVGFMHAAIERCPWISRAIEAKMLPYYESRDDGPQIITYAEKMLSGLPNSPEYMLALARGYVLIGRLDKAEKVWLHLTTIHPDNLDALLALGNYYYNIGDKANAAKYLGEAFKLKATPFVEQRLKSIHKELEVTGRPS